MNLVDLQGLPYMTPNLVNFGPETTENGWRVFAHPHPHFRIGRHCQPYRMDVNAQQANFGACYVVARAYSLERQNAGQAHAGLCHASSSIFIPILIPSRISPSRIDKHNEIVVYVT